MPASPRRLAFLSLLLLLSFSCASVADPESRDRITISTREVAEEGSSSDARRYWVRFTNSGDRDAWFHYEQYVEQFEDGEWQTALDGSMWIVLGPEPVLLPPGSEVDYATPFTTDDVPQATLRLVVRVHEGADRRSAGRWVVSDPFAVR